MYVVTVKFLIKESQIKRFMPLMLQQAKDSLALEPSCTHFDVAISDTNPNLVFLYEIYDCKADFDFHLSTDHFVSFSEKVAELVDEKHVEVFNLR